MKILITGGAGFLGAALANRLVEQGHRVRVLDDLSSGDKARLHEQVVFVNGDVRDIPKLWSLLRGIDCVYHLAARVSVPESVLYPVEYNDVNVGGTVSLLTAMRDARVQRLVFVSSGAIYGEQPAQPVAETATLHPTTPYSVSKMASEAYIAAIGRLWAIETVILRVFNAYGPGQPLPPSHAPVVSRFLRQAIADGSVVISGDGQQTRDFVYVADVVRALIGAATAERVVGTILNVGSGVEVSIAGLADTIEHVLGRPVHRLYNSEQTSGVRRLVGDISRARELLGYVPTVSLPEGLRLMLQSDPRFALNAGRTGGADSDH